MMSRTTANMAVSHKLPDGEIPFRLQPQMMLRIFGRKDHRVSDLHQHFAGTFPTQGTFFTPCLNMAVFHKLPPGSFSVWVRRPQTTAPPGSIYLNFSRLQDLPQLAITIACFFYPLKITPFSPCPNPGVIKPGKYRTFGTGTQLCTAHLLIRHCPEFHLFHLFHHFSPFWTFSANFCPILPLGFCPLGNITPSFSHLREYHP